MQKVILTTLFIGFYVSLFSQIDRLERELDSLFQHEMNEQRIPGAALIIVRGNEVLLKKGYGFTTPEEGMNFVNSDSTIFRIGSVTKSFTALALLQQIDEGKIKLNDDVNRYLTSLQVQNFQDQTITPFHLLTHSAGFDEIGGRRVFDASAQIPLADFLKSNLNTIRNPGEVTAYSTYGISLAGQLVEDLSSQPLEEYLRKQVWEPLDMNMTSISLLEEHVPYTSLGYEIYNNINIPQAWEWYHTFPASSINSTVADMGNYMQMLLNGGTFDNKVILNENLVKRMLSQQLSIHPKADGFTFGLYGRKWNGVSSINHGGEMLGYSSFMTLLPEEKIGIFVVHHHEGTSLRYRVIETIISALVEDAIVQEYDEISRDVSPFAGRYRWLSNCQQCPNSAGQQSWVLEANDDGTLTGFNRTFFQIEPLLFKSTDGQRTMGFKKDDAGKIKYMTLGNVNVFEKIR
jgi:CubicO group peptidase (beta-lactamase class C family)